MFLFCKIFNEVTINNNNYQLCYGFIYINIHLTLHLHFRLGTSIILCEKNCKNFLSVALLRKCYELQHRDEDIEFDKIVKIINIRLSKQ